MVDHSAKKFRDIDEIFPKFLRFKRSPSVTHRIGQQPVSVSSNYLTK